MKELRIIDGHCDTLTNLLDRSSTINDSVNHVSLENLIKGRVYIQFFAAWIGSRQKYGSPLQRGLKLIDRYYNMLEGNSRLVPILQWEDVNKIGNDQIGALLTIEDGNILEGELANLRILYKLGVRLMTLTWNHRNEICDGIMETNSQSGLSNFGISVIQEMNKLNMIIDISHLSVPAFWDVIEYSKAPIIASHSNAKAVCPHPRNLDDKQILAISEVNGLIGINFYPLFLSEKNCGIEDIVKHIEYIAGLVGVDVVGFGSDFDGVDHLPDGINGPQDFPKIINRLLQLNYLEDDIKKICSGNYLRIIKTILK